LNLQDDEQNQLRTKIKIEGTIDKALFEEFKKIYELETAEAEAEDKAQPNVSQILEMLLRKGIKSYKSAKKKPLR